MAEVKQADPAAKLKADLDFWMTAADDAEKGRLALVTKVSQLETDLADRLEKLESSRKVVDDLRGHLTSANGLLRELADHVAGRNGMLEKSHSFCGVCQNPTGCPVGRAWELIGE